MRRHAIVAALAGSAILAGCGSSDEKAPSAASTDTIRIAQFEFAPDPATVKVGRKVTITNADSAPHTLTEEGGSPAFDSGTIRGKARGSVTFKKAGTFHYYCQFHATMKGTVTVVE